MQSGKVVFISDLISNSNKYASQFVRVVGYVRDIDFQSLKFVLEDDRHRLLVDSRLLDLASLRPGDLIQIWGDFNVNMDGVSTFSYYLLIVCCCDCFF